MIIISLYPHIHRNAIKAIGYEIKDVTTPEEIDSATMIIFPGVGSFGQAILVSYYYLQMLII